MSALPAYAIGGVVLAYWGCVVAKIVRAARKSRGIATVFVPRQAVEKRMWLVWTPTILAWIVLPFVIPNQDAERRFWLALPELEWPALLIEAPRWLAVIAAVGLLAASIHCWRYMGRCWRLGVDPTQHVLLTGGPFRWARHPIYALGRALMACTVIAVPAPIMLVVAATHFTMVHLKARVEERFLLGAHGSLYEDYALRTGRFAPRLRSLVRSAATG